MTEVQSRLVAAALMCSEMGLLALCYSFFWRADEPWYKGAQLAAHMGIWLPSRLPGRLCSF